MGYSFSSYLPWGYMSGSSLFKSCSGLALLLVISLLNLIACGGGGGSSSIAPPPPLVTLASINVTPANPSVALGLTQQFSATGTYSDGTSRDISTSVAWSSASAGVASIGVAGRASSVAQGASTITAALGNVKGTTTLTITPAVLTSISVSPATAAVQLGSASPQKFTVNGTYSDQSIVDLSSQATWSVTNPHVAKHRCDRCRFSTAHRIYKADCRLWQPFQ